MRVLSSLRRAVFFISVFLGLAESRGRRRGRRGRSTGRRSNRAVSEEEKKQLEPTKPEEALAKCERKPPMPPQHRIGGVPPDARSEEPDSWRYLRRVTDHQFANGMRIEKVDWTPQRATLCQAVFANRMSPAKLHHEHSTTTCMLSLGKDGMTEQALFVSDYNTERGLPNFVAFAVPSKRSGSGQWHTIQDPSTAMVGLDDGYSTRDSPEKCCWCAPENGEPDAACQDPAGKSGVLAPLAAFESTQMDAANVFLNAVPTRLPFHQQQWTRRLKDVFTMAQRQRHRERSIHVLIGPSLQVDGYLKTKTSNTTIEGIKMGAEGTVDVPSFLWTAYSDPYAHSGGGFFCRNGGPDDDCACVDGLQMADMEPRLGIQFFPGVRNPRYMPLAQYDASNSIAWYILLYLGIIIGCCVIMVWCMLWSESDRENERDEVREARIRNQRRLQDDSPKSPTRALQSKWETVARERSRRKSLESAVGGKEALQARFRAI